MDDLAPIVGLGAQLADQRCIVAIGHKADVLAVGLGRDAQAQVACDFAHHALSKPAQRKAQEIELLLRRREPEIALVAGRIARAVDFGARRPPPAAHKLAGWWARGPTGPVTGRGPSRAEE